MGQPTYKATVEVGDKKVTIEGPRDFVEEQLSRLTGAPSKRSSESIALGSAETHDAGKMSEHDLIEAKRPKGHPETIAVLAFALAEAGVTDFDEADMRRAYLRAGVRPPKVMGQAIRDAKNRFDYIEVGPERGRYCLSPHGDRTVRFDVPRQ